MKNFHFPSLNSIVFILVPCSGKRHILFLSGSLLLILLHFVSCHIYVLSSLSCHWKIFNRPGPQTKTSGFLFCVPPLCALAQSFNVFWIQCFSRLCLYPEVDHLVLIYSFYHEKLCQKPCWEIPYLWASSVSFGTLSKEKEHIKTMFVWRGLFCMNLCWLLEITTFFLKRLQSNSSITQVRVCWRPKLNSTGQTFQNLHIPPLTSRTVAHH